MRVGTCRWRGETLTLEREDSLTLSAGPRGRADIIGVRPPYTAWIQNNGDIYDIRFVDRERFDLEIRNYSPAALAITEKNGYLDPPSLAVPAAGRAAGRLYTDKPVFALTGSPVWKLRYVDGTCIVGIDPPAGDWWEHDYP